MMFADLCRWSLVIFALAVLPALTGVAAAKNSEQLEFGIEEHLGGYIPADLEFVDSDGKPVRLGELTGKPTILALVYYKCASVCNPLMIELSTIVTELPEVPGIDYQLLTIGFDPRETPGDAATMKKNLFQSMELNGKKVDPAAWHFLTGEQESIDKLTDAVGFRYVKQSDTEFLHPTNLAILAADGKICRYMQGFGFVAADFRLSLEYARKGLTGSARLATPRNVGMFKQKSALRAFCYRVDPESGAQVLNVTRIVGVVMLLSAGCMMLLLFWADKAAGRKLRKLSVDS